MEYSNVIDEESLARMLNSPVLFDVAYAAAHLGMSGDPKAVESLTALVNTSDNWLIQEFGLRALMFIGLKDPAVLESLKGIKRIESPASGLIVELKPVNWLPFVSLDFERGTLLIEGLARAESLRINQVFSSINAEIDLFDKMYPDKPLIVTLNLDSFTSLFCKLLGSLLKKLNQRRETIIYLYYLKEDEDMLDLSEDYNQIFGLKIINIFKDDVYYSDFWKFQEILKY